MLITFPDLSTTTMASPIAAGSIFALVGSGEVVIVVIVAAAVALYKSVCELAVNVKPEEVSASCFCPESSLSEP